jgi:hypothetical protein
MIKRSFLKLLIVACMTPLVSHAENRLVMIVGVDISGSFLKGKYFNDSIDFLAHYLYAHLHGLSGTEKPSQLFVGTLGGQRVGEAKTFYPIELFENEDIDGLKKKLKEVFPRNTKSNALTDFNAFFEQAAQLVKTRRLILKPISIVMLSDGQPDMPGEKTGTDEIFHKINLNPLELLSRNITVRLLYTDAVTSKRWQTMVPRKRVKVWTQDAEVMKTWKDDKIFAEDKPMEDQTKLLSWMHSNVDFDVRSQRVN